MNLKCPFLSFFTFFSNTNSYILFSLFILAFFLFFSFCWDITIYLINVICILESVFTSIFSPTWAHFSLLWKPDYRLHVNTEIKSDAAVFSRSSFRLNWNFTSGIFVPDSYVWTIFSLQIEIWIFHAALTSWHYIVQNITVS